MMRFLVPFLVIIAALLCLYLYWRYYFFFRDPDRHIAAAENAVVSPADGTVMYIKEVVNGELLFSTKKQRIIHLQRYSAEQQVELPCFLIGIFMHPTSVHVNRAPIAGKVEKIDYLEGKNLPMTLTWWRVNLGLKPYEKYAGHLSTNERNIVSILGKIRVVVVQIADIYVNKIECWVKEQEQVAKGQRIGMIKLGSQVDVLLPKVGVEIAIKAGQKLKAGESVIAYIKQAGE